ncbi:MAG: ROK family protein [Alphaproteobacteria bacterium]
MKIGVDLGGTKIEAIVLDRDGAERFRKRIRTPEHYEERVDAVSELVAQARATAGPDATIGIGTPGTTSPHTGRMQNAENLIGQTLRADLEHALGQPVRMANDANCFALSEAIDGAAAEYNVVFGVILGTGVGGGLVIDGTPITGRNAITGEWGHNPLPRMRGNERPGPDCYCGRRGCIETFLNGRGLTRAYLDHCGEMASPETIAHGDTPHKAAALEVYVDRLARALATMINIIDPDVIVLGGGLSNIEYLYEALPPLLRPHIFSDGFSTPIVKAKHGDSSGVRGAALLWN